MFLFKLFENVIRGDRKLIIFGGKHNSWNHPFRLYQGIRVHTKVSRSSHQNVKIGVKI